MLGAQGRQGSAVVEALLVDQSLPVSPEKIHVITRNTAGAVATHLSQRGIQLVQGDLNAPAPILKHLEKTQIDARRLGVFLAQAHGPRELSDAKGFIDACCEAGVAYFVYSSVDRGGKEASDRDASYCKTFLDKFHIEKHFIAASKDHGMNYTILRPTWFAENADWGCESLAYNADMRRH